MILIQQMRLFTEEGFLACGAHPGSRLADGFQIDLAGLSDFPTRASGKSLPSLVFREVAKVMGLVRVLGLLLAQTGQNLLVLCRLG